MLCKLHWKRTRLMMLSKSVNSTRRVCCNSLNCTRQGRTTNNARQGVSKSLGC